MVCYRENQSHQPKARQAGAQVHDRSSPVLPTSGHTRKMEPRLPLPRWLRFCSVQPHPGFADTEATRKYRPAVLGLRKVLNEELGLAFVFPSILTSSVALLGEPCSFSKSC